MRRKPLILMHFSSKTTAGAAARTQRRPGQPVSTGSRARWDWVESSSKCGARPFPGHARARFFATFLGAFRTTDLVAFFAPRAGRFAAVRADLAADLAEDLATVLAAFLAAG